MRLMLCLILLTLVGCASYADRMDEPPAYTGQTDKSPDEFAGCAMPIIMRTASPARVVPDGDARQIIAGDALATTTYYVLTAYPDGRVEYRGMDWPEIKQAIDACV